MEYKKNIFQDLELQTTIGLQSERKFRCQQELEAFGSHRCCRVWTRQERLQKAHRVYQCLESHSELETKEIQSRCQH